MPSGIMPPILGQPRSSQDLQGGDSKECDDLHPSYSLLFSFQGPSSAPRTRRRFFETFVECRNVSGTGL